MCRVGAHIFIGPSRAAGPRHRLGAGFVLGLLTDEPQGELGRGHFFSQNGRQFRGIGIVGDHHRFFIGENGGVLAPWDGTFNHQPQWVKQLGLPSFNHHFPYDMCKIPNF